MSDLAHVHRNAAALRRSLSERRGSSDASYADMAAAALHDEHARCLANHGDIGRKAKLARIAMWRIEAVYLFQSLYRDALEDAPHALEAIIDQSRS